MNDKTMKTILDNLEAGMIAASENCKCGVIGSAEELGKMFGLYQAIDMICQIQDYDPDSEVMNYDVEEGVVVGFPTTEDPTPEVRTLEVADIAPCSPAELVDVEAVVPEPQNIGVTSDDPDEAIAKAFNS